MKKMFILKKLLSLLVFSLLASCVGTVEEAGVDGSFTTVVNDINIQFVGVEEVVGILKYGFNIFRNFPFLKELNRRQKNIVVYKVVLLFVFSLLAIVV